MIGQIHTTQDCLCRGRQAQIDTTDFTKGSAGGKVPWDEYQLPDRD